MGIVRSAGKSALLFALLFWGCSKGKLVGPLEFVPADVHLVAVLDTRSFLQLAQQELLPLLPTEAEALFPGWQEVRGNVQDETGIDLERLQQVVVMLRRPVEAKFPLDFEAAVAVSGIDPAEVKGQKVGEHLGTALYQHEFPTKYKVVFAKMDADQVVFAEKKELVQEVLDTKARRSKSFLDVVKQEELQDLVTGEPGLNHFRVYTASLSSFWKAPMPAPFRAAALAVDFSKGISFMALPGETGLENLLSAVRGGYEFLRVQMAQMGAGVLPLGFDPGRFETLGKMLEQAKIEKQDSAIYLRVQGNVGKYLMGNFLAAAVPEMEDAVRKSKASEIYKNLEACHLGAIQYYQTLRKKPDGSMANLMPPSMDEPICPKGTTKADLGPRPAPMDPAAFAPGGKGAVLGAFNLVITDPVFACYQFTTDAPGQPLKDGQGFTCEAWTDLDGNKKNAHWIKASTWQAQTSSFRVETVLREGDKW